jgi:hypothetical protein
MEIAWWLGCVLLGGLAGVALERRRRAREERRYVSAIAEAQFGVVAHANETTAELRKRVRESLYLRGRHARGVEPTWCPPTPPAEPRCGVERYGRVPCRACRAREGGAP